MAYYKDYDDDDDLDIDENDIGHIEFNSVEDFINTLKEIYEIEKKREKILMVNPTNMKKLYQIYTHLKKILDNCGAQYICKILTRNDSYITDVRLIITTDIIDIDRDDIDSLKIISNEFDAINVYPSNEDIIAISILVKDVFIEIKAEEE